VNVFMIRIMNLPALLVIALYEQQAKHNGTTGFYETLIVVTERAYDSLPRQLKRLCGGLDIPTAGQIQEEEGSAGGASQWSERLAKLEERQERIENLLEGIAKDLRDRGKV
ncbi:hypothetical protein GG344DRAFT_71521, partial [Lentinula edodes]